jgi:hypothetical protein
VIDICEEQVIESVLLLGISFGVIGSFTLMGIALTIIYHCTKKKGGKQ